MRIVVAGGGLAGQRCVETLRRAGHDGPLTMVCAEEHLPYDRPPLSKELLAGERAAGSLSFRDEAWYADHDVDLLLGTRATGLTEHALATTGGLVPYDRLLVATGARPRELPAFAGLENVFTLRDVGDAEALAPHLGEGRRLTVVGAGFIGLEVAATAAARGTEVTILEALHAPLAPVVGLTLGGWFADFHRRAGIDVRVGARIARVCTEGNSVTAIELIGGDRIESDAVLVAIGVEPATKWLDRTFPGVVAAGDAAGHHHWESAARGGAAAARQMLGQPAAPELPASFWSDQHGVRIQLVGDPSGADLVDVDGDRHSADFAATWTRAGRPAAVLLVGRPSALPDARRLVAGAPTPERKAA